MMNQIETYPEVFIRNKNTVNRLIFNTFLDELQCPMLLENGDVIVKASISYYCREQLHRDVMIVKLITHGYDAGDVHIISNSKTITPENFELVLKCDESKYSLGRSGTELVIESRSSKMGGSYRIDLEEKLYGVA
jgi:hypothetical protein